MWRKYPLKTAKKSAFVTKFSLKMSVKRFALPGAFLGSENVDKQAETLDFKPKMDISNRTEKRSSRGFSRGSLCAIVSKFEED